MFRHTAFTAGFLLAIALLTNCSSPPPPPSPTQISSGYGQPTAPQAPSAPSIPLFRSAPPDVFAESYILIDGNTGATLASKDADVQRPVASTQKILTALVVVGSGNLDRPVRVERSDTLVEPTKLGLRAGSVHSRRELLYTLLVKSCNDVAMALARDNAGSVGNFAVRMNYTARALGARNSQFSNPHGLTASNNYSTARDMARIALAAHRNPLIRDIIRRPYYVFHGKTLKNTNELLGKMPGCDGMKTGYTHAADRCLISCASQGGRSVILVQLGTKTKYIWNDGEALMRWGLGG